MTTYVILMRGINVGGKNKIAMAKLKPFLEELGASDVTTYIQSGNAVLQSGLAAAALGKKILRRYRRTQLPPEIVAAIYGEEEA